MILVICVFSEVAAQLPQVAAADPADLADPADPADPEPDQDGPEVA